MVFSNLLDSAIEPPNFCSRIAFDCSKVSFLPQSNQFSTLNVSNFFSLVVKQSTSTFFYKHFFDNIIVQPLLEDSLPPYIVDLNLLSPTTLKIIFNEPLDKNIAEDVSNYLIEDLLIHPLSATLDSLNSAQILLRFSDSFPQRERLVLKVRNIQDLWFNTLSEADFNFNYILPKRFDILINEIIAVIVI